MSTRYRFEPLTEDEATRWDELTAACQNRELFHRKVWLDYLAQSRQVDIRLWSILDGVETVGYFCGGIARKGPFRILGSPLKGWGTNFMGPVASTVLDPDALLKALDALASAERLAMIELESRSLCESPLRAADFEPVPGWTYTVAITPDNLDTMWAKVDSTCRNRIRKAMKSGLTVEDTADPGIADEFYDQYVDLMQRKGLVPPYPREYPHLLVNRLKKADLLFALRVRDSAGRLLATGLFPHDDSTIYFWGGASWEEGRDLCPNEFLHWSAMRLAAERGLHRYDMCGFGRFKKKFGGTLTPLSRWHKCYWKTAQWARRGYEVYFRKRMQLLGWLQAATHPGKEL